MQTAQHSTAQHSTAQHSTAQQSAAHNKNTLVYVANTYMCAIYNA